MTRRLTCWTLTASVLLLPLAWSGAEARPPVTGQEQEQAVAEYKAVRIAAAQEADDDGRYRLIEKAFADTRHAFIKLHYLNMANNMGGERCEPFLLNAAKDPSASVRVKAINMLAEHGSPAAIDRLLAFIRAEPAPDPEHDLPGRTFMQRAAYFALAEIGLRHKASVERIVEGIQATEATVDDLPDVKAQSLYILTKNAELIAPFFKRLSSQDPKERIHGVTAFRFLKLDKAPNELVALLDDPNSDVRSWTTLTLGEIGDPAYIDKLIKMATDKTEEHNVRANAIMALGRMRARQAVPVLEVLLEDEQLQANAAIALSHIHRKRHPLVPEGYDTGETD